MPRQRNSDSTPPLDKHTTSNNEKATLLRTLFPGASEMAQRMRTFDWSKTDLGVPERWPQNLKTSVRITLTSRHPMFVWWGERLINLYNDGYAAFLYAKHPAALGQPASAVWPEIWDEIGPRVEFAMHRDEGTYDEALPFIMYRKGYPEETYVTFSYSPIPDDRGGTGGILCPVTEETGRIIGERQLALLRELAARTADARTWQKACTLAASALETDSSDLSFALIYVIDQEKRTACLAGTSGIARGTKAAPETVPLDAPSLWPLAEVTSSRRARLVSDLTAVTGVLPTGRGQHPLKQALAMPIAPSGETGMAAVLVVGLNPLRLFDDSYQRFLELVASQLSAAIANGQAYEDERRRAEALAELDRAKTAFFSNVSHEFRTPLTLMLGPIEDMLARSGSADLSGATAISREELGLVHRNALRLLKLVNALLDFSRIEAGRIEAVYEPTDLAAYTTELAGVFRSAIERADLRFIIDCPRLPEPVYVDREMWEKIVLNLISNAFKFTFEGEINVRLRWDGGRAELTVADTGVGIAAAELPHLFERFHRVRDARARTHEGTGIGLALVQELVKLHGGEISVESAVGRGTSFSVSIPTGIAHLPEERISAERPATSTAVGAKPFVEEAWRWLPDNDFGLPILDFGSAPPESVQAASKGDETVIPKSKILVADDNADMRQYVQRLLADRYRVTVVADGVAALEAARREPPDLILTDVMMPNLDGFGLLAAVRSDTQLAGVPVVLLSARAGQEATVEGIRAGADDYLIKPFSARELLARVDAQVRRKRAEEERERLLKELANSQHLFQRIVETSPNALYIYDVANGRTEYVNARSEQVIGYTEAEVMALGDRLAVTLWHPDDLLRLSQYRRNIKELTAGEIEEYEYRVRQPDGTYRWLHSHVAAFARAADGQVRQIIIVTQNVTDQKQAEAALRRSEECFRSIFELGLIGMAITSPTKGILEVNDEICKILGYERDELLRMTWAELTHPDDVATDVEQFNRVMAGEMDGYVMDKRWVRKDGQVIDATISVKCVRRADGSVDYFVALLQDITKRKQTNEALRRARHELEQRVIERTSQLSAINEELIKEVAERKRAEAHLAYQAHLLANVHDAIVATDTELNLTAWNRAAEERYGWKAEEVLGRKVNEVIRSEFTAAQRAEAVQRLAETGHYAAEVIQHCRNGRRLWVQDDTIALHDEAGHIVGYVSTSRDITQRKQVEEQLRRSEAYLAEGQRLSHTASWAWNVATGEVFWSQEMYRIYGLDPQQVVPDYLSLMQYIHPEDRLRVQQAFENAVRKRRDYELAYRLVWADGTIRYVNNLAHAVFDQYGTLVEYVGTAIDTTERVRAEEALQKSQAELAHVSRVTALGELTASIAHEVNQPLGAIVTNGQAVGRLLAREPPDLAKSREAVEHMISDGMRASHVIARIRALLKKQDGEKVPLDINEMIQEVIALTRAELGKSEIHLRIELGAGLPAVLGDRVQLQQVVLNLILNAKEAVSAAGWPTRQLAIRSQPRQPHEVLVAVRDSGTGIEEQAGERIFEAFYTTKAGGLGLGLSISRRIIEAHGGRLWAIANQGQGSTFQFTLPACDERTR